ncbi:MAG: hypothetical protein DRI57_23900 [Deltaproteobacteria bacterium]|nr:MAG: hypothetical protein DRI57_23900 [Deltaproteobacteria bacterium]
MPGTDIRFILRSAVIFPGTTKSVRIRNNQKKGGSYGKICLTAHIPNEIRRIFRAASLTAGISRVTDHFTESVTGAR